MTSHVLFPTSMHVSFGSPPGEHLCRRADVTLVCTHAEFFDSSNLTSTTLEHWNSVFKIHSVHLCLHVCVFVLTCVGREALRRDDPSYKESFQMIVMQIPKPGKTGAFGPHWSVVPCRKKTPLVRIMYFAGRYAETQEKIRQIGARSWHCVCFHWECYTGHVSLFSLWTGCVHWACIHINYQNQTVFSVLPVL